MPEALVTDAAPAAASSTPAAATGAPANEPIVAQAANIDAVDQAAAAASAAATKAAVEAGPVVYNPTGDPGLDVALDFIGNLGLGPDHPAMKAVMDNGDFTLLKSELTALGDKAKGWEKMVALGERWNSEQQTNADAKSKENLAAIVGVVGDEKTWNEVRTWAAANSDANEKKTVNAAFEAGGLAAKAMAKYLHEAYTLSKQKTPAGATPFKAAQTNNAVAGEALSPRAYVAEVQKLSSSQRQDGHPAYESLKSRRANWRG